MKYLKKTESALLWNCYGEWRGKLKIYLLRRNIRPMQWNNGRVITLWLPIRWVVKSEPIKYLTRNKTASFVLLGTKSRWALVIFSPSRDNRLVLVRFKTPSSPSQSLIAECIAKHGVSLSSPLCGLDRVSLVCAPPNYRGGQIYRDVKFFFP